MDLTQILTLLGIVIANIGTTIGLFIWATGYTDKLRESVEEGRKETNAILRSIADEMKDFHGRLCAIEERAKVNFHKV